MSQSLPQIYIHAIFSTRNREPVLAEGWRDELFQVIGGVVNGAGYRSLIVGGVSDHVHLLFCLGRTVAIADAMRAIKSNSSAWVNQKRDLPTSFHWQSGYAVFSVSQLNLEAVRDYVHRQPEHHARVAFQDELREWLRRYEIEWDEQYLWD